MYPVSAAFLAEVRRSHTAVAEADLCDDTGAVLVPGLTVLSGSVTVDRGRACRREASTVLLDPTGTITPADKDDLLAPTTGNEVRLRRGVRYADGTEEYASLGVFRMTNVEVEETGNGVQIPLTLRDRSERIRRARFTRPFSIPADTPVEEAISDLLASRWADCPTNFQTTGARTPAIALGLDAENDPWADAQAIAVSAGFDLLFDADGVAVLRRQLDGADLVPVATYEDGADAVLTRVRKSWDVDNAYNGVVVTAEGSGLAAPIRVEVWDDDPDSPTYYLGSYGMVPRFYSSSLITDEGQAGEAGRNLLLGYLGVAETIAWDQVVNPALDADDALTIIRDNIRVDGTSATVIDSLTIPLLASEGMSGTSRTRRVL